MASNEEAEPEAGRQEAGRPAPARHSTGVAALDAHLGGGLVPGTLTVVVGATGIGKTQLGVQYALAGARDEAKRGIIFDMSARGDSQSHRGYAQRLGDWTLQAVDSQAAPCLDDFYSPERSDGDYLHVFDYRGQRVTRRDLEWEQWQSWQAELNAKLRQTIAFLYGNFVRGTRRVVVDGVEPVESPHESIQLNLFEYVYHQVLRKDPEWVARDLFRERFRQVARSAAEACYPTNQLGCLLLFTSREAMLDELIARPLDEGDALSNANTLIYMGKIRQGNRVGRGLYVAKHRGSACSDQILEYEVTDDGLRLCEG